MSNHLSNYCMPARMKQLQNRVRSEISQFLEKHAPEDSVLVLDSTGPMVTRHYLVLSAIGRERLLRFKKIHAFSGGAFAIFGFLGLTSNNAKFPFSELRSRQTEQLFRGYHHRRPFSVSRVLMNLAQRTSAFESDAPLRAMLAHIFRAEYLNQPFHQFPSNVVLHLGQKNAPSIVRLSNGPECDEPCLPLRNGSLGDAVVSAITVPMLYGSKNGQDKFFDPVYVDRGYAIALKAASRSGHPTLVSTPWRSGQKGDIQFINCFPTGNQKTQMLKDFALLVLNMPNRGWGDDIYAAFES